MGPWECLSRHRRGSVNSDRPHSGCWMMSETRVWTEERFPGRSSASLAWLPNLPRVPGQLFWTRETETVDVRDDVELRVIGSRSRALALLPDDVPRHRSRHLRPPECLRWSAAGLGMEVTTLATRFRLSTGPRCEPAGPTTRRSAPPQHSGCYSQSESRHACVRTAEDASVRECACAQVG